MPKKYLDTRQRRYREVQRRLWARYEEAGMDPIQFRVGTTDPKTLSWYRKNMLTPERLALEQRSRQHHIDVALKAQQAKEALKHQGRDVSLETVKGLVNNNFTFTGIKDPLSTTKFVKPGSTSFPTSQNGYLMELVK